MPPAARIASAASTMVPVPTPPGCAPPFTGSTAGLATDEATGVLPGIAMIAFRAGSRMKSGPQISIDGSQVATDTLGGWDTETAPGGGAFELETLGTKPRLTQFERVQRSVAPSAAAAPRMVAVLAPTTARLTRVGRVAAALIRLSAGVFSQSAAVAGSLML